VFYNGISSSGAKMYINGAAQTLTASGGINSETANATAYLAKWTGGGIGFGGTIDELRISSGERGADWILAEYNNQNSPSTFYTVGSETPLGGGTPCSIAVMGAGACFVQDSANAIIIGTQANQDASALLQCQASQAANCPVTTEQVNTESAAFATLAAAVFSDLAAISQGYDAAIAALQSRLTADESSIAALSQELHARADAQDKTIAALTAQMLALQNTPAGVAPAQFAALQQQLALDESAIKTLQAQVIAQQAKLDALKAALGP
jgi:hypothetical protein